MARRTSITEHIVNLLAKTEAATETFLEFTYHPYRYVYKNLVDEVGIKEANIKQAFARLEKGGVLTRKLNKDQEVLFKLADKGQLMWLKGSLKSGKINNLKNEFVIAVFDIPEESRVVRNALRRNLKEFGFKPWQKSVWVTNKDVFDLAKQYFKLTGLTRHVIIFETKRSSQK